jgi:hypothetical protein
MLPYIDGTRQTIRLTLARKRGQRGSRADCTTTNSPNGSYSLTCAPNVVPGISGAPSESDLTAINSQRGFARNDR